MSMNSGPIEQKLLYQRVTQKYADPDAIHHWETQEVILEDENIVFMEKVGLSMRVLEL